MECRDDRRGAGVQKQRVLFICTHNSARSQMAEGYLRAHHGELFEAASAGTEVRAVHPAAIAVMAEIGIDIAGHRSKSLHEFTGQGTDIAVTVCDSARGACPFFPGAKETIHAGFPDPSACNGTPAECLDQFREVRDAIVAWIEESFVPVYRSHGPDTRTVSSRKGRIRK
jgi:arsenate reductase